MQWDRISKGFSFRHKRVPLVLPQHICQNLPSKQTWPGINNIDLCRCMPLLRCENDQNDQKYILSYFRRPQILQYWNNWGLKKDQKPTRSLCIHAFQEITIEKVKIGISNAKLNKKIGIECIPNDNLKISTHYQDNGKNYTQLQTHHSHKYSTVKSWSISTITQFLSFCLYMSPKWIWN